MGFISRIFGTSFLLLISAQAQASTIDHLSGIDIISENHHVWGFSRIYPAGGTFTYDLESPVPISFDSADAGVGALRSMAEAGDFRVNTYTSFSGTDGAYAQSTYLFTPEWTQLALNAFGGGNSWMLSFLSSEITISLLDTTTDQVLLSERFGEVPEGCAGCSAIGVLPYSLDLMYLFDVNPSHVYELSILAKSIGSQLTRPNTNLQAELSAVPVPAAFWLFGSALIGLIGFSRRNKAVS